MNKLNRILTVILVVAIVAAVAGPVLASNLTKTVTLTYQDIKITLDGQPVIPTDANGNEIEPFIIDGTTYLPVRGVASALGLDVSWDASANTVGLTSRAAVTTAAPIASDAPVSSVGTAPTTNTGSRQDGLPDFITRQKPGEYNYVVNLNTGKFHDPNCKSVGDILPENLAYCTGTRDQLIAAGYSPCGNCKP